MNKNTIERYNLHIINKEQANAEINFDQKIIKKDASEILKFANASTIEKLLKIIKVKKMSRILDITYEVSSLDHILKIIKYYEFEDITNFIYNYITKNSKNKDLILIFKKKFNFNILLEKACEDNNAEVVQFLISKHEYDVKTIRKMIKIINKKKNPIIDILKPLSEIKILQNNAVARDFPDILKVLSQTSDSKNTLIKDLLNVVKKIRNEFIAMMLVFILTILMLFVGCSILTSKMIFNN